jgi:hypothetical protein
VTVDASTSAVALNVDSGEHVAAALRAIGIRALVEYRDDGGVRLAVRGPNTGEALFPLTDDECRQPRHVDMLHEAAGCLTDIVTVLKATEAYPRRDSRLFDLAYHARWNIDEVLLSGLSTRSTYRVGDHLVLEGRDTARFYQATIHRIYRGADDSELIDVITGTEHHMRTPEELDYLTARTATTDNDSTM